MTTMSEYVDWCRNNDMSTMHFIDVEDNDFYNFTMGQFVFYNHPDVIVKYKFVNRNPDMKLISAKDLNHLLDLYHDALVPMKNKYIRYMASMGFFRDSYLNFLSNFKYEMKYIDIQEIDGQLDITLNGPWYKLMYYDVMLLSFISRFSLNNYQMIQEMDRRLDQKINRIKSIDDPGFKIVDMSTRRRCDFSWQKYMINRLKTECPDNFVGTSNLKLAHDLNTRCIGTMAHELIQAYQQLDYKIKESQKKCFMDWANFYRGSLGIALTDCISMDAFLEDFDLYLSKLFDGCRHDSACPYIWTDKLIKHYENFKIDPMSKTAVYSNSLNIQSAYEIYCHYKNHITTSFGIGTFLGNDCGLPAPNIIIKMVECNGEPVAKLCMDEPNKTMCKDDQYLTYLKRCFGYN